MKIEKVPITVARGPTIIDLLPPWKTVSAKDTFKTRWRRGGAEAAPRRHLPGILPSDRY